MEDRIQVKDGRKAPFYWIDKQVIKRFGRDLKASGIGIYNILCYHANQKTGECFPSMAKVAEELDISYSLVQEKITLMEKLKLIKKRHRKGKSTTYTILTVEAGETNTVPDSTTHRTTIQSTRIQIVEDHIINNKKEQEEITSVPEHTPSPSFPLNLTPLIEEFIELTRNENKTKTLSPRRQLRLTTELYSIFEQAGEQKFQECLKITLDNEAPNINYLKKVLKGYDKRQEKLHELGKAGEGQELIESRKKVKLAQERTNKLLDKYDFSKRT